MKRNKILAIGLTLILAAGLLVGCGSKTEQPANNEQPNSQTEAPGENNAPAETGAYEDGIYFAQQEFNEKTGWKYMVTIEVKDGKIVAADWNGAHKDAGKHKNELSEAGEYVMVEGGTPWHKQAEVMENYLIEKQDPTDIKYLDDDGHVDVVSGVSIKVKDFFELAEAALANGPVGRGQYTDGAYHAEDADFAEKSGWKNTVDLTVVNGYIVAAKWNAVHKDGGDDKVTQSINGEYVMTQDGMPWHEQAALMEAHLLETQDPTAIELNDEGKTDAFAGVSMGVADFFRLAEEALK